MRAPPGGALFLYSLYDSFGKGASSSLHWERFRGRFLHETGSVEAADARGGGADAKGPGGDPGMGMMRADRTLPDLSLAVRQLGTLFFGRWHDICAAGDGRSSA